MERPNWKHSALLLVVGAFAGAALASVMAPPGRQAEESPAAAAPHAAAPAEESAPASNEIADFPQLD
jgi:hypothetical protein